MELVLGSPKGCVRLVLGVSRETSLHPPVAQGTGHCLCDWGLSPPPSNSPIPAGCPTTQLNSDTVPGNTIQSHRLRAQSHKTPSHLPPPSDAGRKSRVCDNPLPGFI